MKPLHSLLLISLCLVLSCKKDKIDIEGYTVTDATGNFMGAIDLTDWTLDASWSNKELDVFAEIDPGSLTGTSSSSIVPGPAFPNPCSNVFTVVFHAPSACKARLALVNKDLDILTSKVIALTAGINTSQIAIPAEAKPGRLYRLYYVFDAEGSPAFFKGHGDIKIQ